MSRPNLRAEMPTVAAWIDDLRAAFGADEINAAIRSGLHGLPQFWAKEGGVEIGSRPPPRDGISLADMVIHQPATLPAKSGRR